MQKLDEIEGLQTLRDLKSLPSPRSTSLSIITPPSVRTNALVQSISVSYHSTDPIALPLFNFHLIYSIVPVCRNVFSPLHSSPHSVILNHFRSYSRHSINFIHARSPSPPCSSSRNWKSPPFGSNPGQRMKPFQNTSLPTCLTE